MPQKEAMDRNDDCPYRRAFHSDKGWAYQMKPYKKAINQAKHLSKYVTKRELF